MSVFDNRTLNEEEKNKVKIAVEATIEALRAISDYNSDIKENLKAVCEGLNEGIDDDDKKIKPAMIRKMAKCRLKEELLAKEKDTLDEVETALEIVYNSTK